MNFRKVTMLVLMTLVSASLFLPSQAKAQVTRQITSSGTTQLRSAPPGTPGIQNPEVDPAIVGDGDSDSMSDGGNGVGTYINRSIAPGHGHGLSVASGRKAKSNPEVGNSFEGLNFFDQRYANGGNQFSVVPPDQGLCVGNGYVLESVNDVLDVYSSDGHSLLGTTDLNTFYKYPAAINRTTGAYGPSITDPSCHFDTASQRWFHVVLTLDRVGTSSSLSGKNHLDIAVSTTANPLDPWTIYRLPVQDDGTDGTPDHHCIAATRNGPVHGPCLGDYPHLGMDANGLYLTTNEFNLFASGFIGAQIYALSKDGLVGGGPVNVAQFDTGALSPSLPYGIPGFTAWPALSPSAADFNTSNNGTEYLLSSIAVFSDTGAWNQLVIWSLSNTQTLNTSSPAVTLNAGLVDTQTYAVPPNSEQKAGDFPLGQCLEDSTIPTPFGVGCWNYFVVSGGPFPEHETELPSNDSRMQQVSYANGKLWSALDTAVTVNGTEKAGAAYFVIVPQGSGTGLKGKTTRQGVLSLANNNITYPAVAVTPSGRGVIGFTVVGSDYYPSAGYASLDAVSGAGDIHVVASGAGPDDGFSAYPQLTAPNPRRPRWGDYGAAAVDGHQIWIANEYIAQTCNLAEFVASNFTCNNTRGAFGNWSTRVTQLQLK